MLAVFLYWMIDEVTIKSSRSAGELKLSEPKPPGSRHLVEYLRMNFAAASCGVSEQVELFLVELFVLCLSPLILDVLLDDALRTVLPDRAHEVAVRPKLAAP